MGSSKSADTIFDTWQLNEPLLKYVNYNEITPHAQWKVEVKKQCATLYNRCSKYPASLQQLKKLSANDFQHLVLLLGHIQKKNISSFINHLKKIHFATLSAKKEDEQAPINTIMTKYNGMMRLLCGSSKRVVQKNFLYALAQDFFDFCFNPKTFDHCKELCIQQNHHALAHLLYSGMWINFGSIGWSTWHENTITRLQDYACHGKEIVYIAGGSDIVQLLKHGIYSIRIIDPFLPTQKTYYSRGWRFLIGSKNTDSLGDTITFSFNKTPIILQRVGYTQSGTLRATLSNGTKRTLPKSITTWNILKGTTKTPVGKLTIERRFICQDDLVYDNSKAMLISFNELHFITTTHEKNWGIDVKKIHPQCILHVKQLQNPLTKPWLCAIQKADRLPLEFIQLGNNID